MLSTGIPELQSERDIEYLRDAFALGMSEEEAGKHFVKLLYQSLNTKATQINFAIHIWAHSD
jgi:phosphatidylinositol-4,5-bisphosphate 3-kinase catalytic subunit alpha/beta/delta